MLSTNTQYINMNNSLARQIKGKVELYNGSTLLHTFNHNDYLQSIHVERAGESGKFFGYGVCQKLTLKLVDRQRQIEIEKGQTLKLYFSNNSIDYIRVCPSFIVDSVERDETTNSITVKAFDKIDKSSNYSFEELPLSAPYTINDIISAVCNILGISSYSVPNGNTEFTRTYTDGANYGGNESLREVLNDISEATQTIYFIDNSDNTDCLYFKECSINGEPDLTISKSHYFELSTQPAKTITGIAHITQLGDNVQAGSGVVQYVRDNPFWENREDIATILETALARVNGLTIIPFSCTWRGNFVCQIADKIAITDKANQVFTTYLLNDSFDYTGGFKEITEWSYEEQKAENAAPTTIGEKINRTIAKVDKLNNEITLIAANTEGFSNDIAQLQLKDQSIEASVTASQTNIEKQIQDGDALNQENINALTDEISRLTQTVSTKISAEDVSIAVRSEIENGVTQVVTETGFTFDSTGLTIDKTGKEMKTTITEDGMTVYKDNEALLTADNQGVDARNLSASTFLIIGGRSRFENYGTDRTGCFWIGG